MGEIKIKIFDVNHGDNLSKFNAPCILFVRNSNTFHWYKGWSIPTRENQIPYDIGNYFRVLKKAGWEAEINEEIDRCKLCYPKKIIADEFLEKYICGICKELIK